MFKKNIFLILAIATAPLSEKLSELLPPLLKSPVSSDWSAGQYNPKDCYQYNQLIHYVTNYMESSTCFYLSI